MLSQCLYAMKQTVCAVHRYEHPVKGQGIYAYVTLMQDTEYSPELKKELVKTVRGHIGAFAAPDVIHWAPGGSPPLPYCCHPS